MCNIITNWRPRALLCLSELPAAAAADFDYVEDDDGFTPRFFQYRGTWFDAHDAQRIEPDTGRMHPIGWAMRVPPGSPLALFDALVSDTYFSGTLWRFVDQGEAVIVGRFFS